MDEISDGINLDGDAPSSNALISSASDESIFNSFYNNNVGGSGTNSLLGGFGGLFNTQGFSSNGAQGLPGVTPDASKSSQSIDLSDLFLRAVIIILGFIFTAVALTMFGSHATNIVIQETKRSFK